MKERKCHYFFQAYHGYLLNILGHTEGWKDTIIKALSTVNYNIKAEFIVKQEIAIVIRHNVSEQKKKKTE